MHIFNYTVLKTSKGNTKKSNKKDFITIYSKKRASEALNKTIDKYNNSEIILDADDYEGVGFNEIAS